MKNELREFADFEGSGRSNVYKQIFVLDALVQGGKVFPIGKSIDTKEIDDLILKVEKRGFIFPNYSYRKGTVYFQDLATRFLEYSKGTTIKTYAPDPANLNLKKVDEIRISKTEMRLARNEFDKLKSENETLKNEISQLNRTIDILSMK